MLTFWLFMSVSFWVIFLGGPTIWLSVFLVMIMMKIFEIQKSSILLLLSLELMSIMSILFISYNFFKVSVTPAMLFLLFTLMVCEASLGLSLLIQSSRKSGSSLLSLYYLKLNKLKAFKAFIVSDAFSMFIMVNFQLKDLWSPNWQNSALNLEFKYSRLLMIPQMNPQNWMFWFFFMTISFLSVLQKMYFQI